MCFCIYIRNSFILDIIWVFMVIKTWRKSDILPKIDSKEYKNLLNELEKNIKFIEGYKNKLKPDFSVKDYISIIKSQEKIADLNSRLHAYAYMWFSEDTTNQQAKSFMSKIDQLSVDNENIIMFFGMWFSKTLDDKNAKRIIDGVDKKYRYILELSRKFKKYLLT